MDNNKTDHISESGTTLPSDNRKVTPAGRLSIILAATIFLIALITAIMFGLAWKRMQALQVNAIGAVEKLQNNLQQLQQQQADLQSNQESLRKLLKQDGNSLNPWQLEEVNYLIQLANLQLHINHNVTAAVLLLQTSQQRIGSIKGPEVMELRQALANDMASLHAVPTFNQAELLLKLNVLVNEIGKLSLVSGHFIPPSDEKKPVAAVSSGMTWSNIYQSIVDTLKQLVIVRHKANALSDIMTPVEAQSLQQFLCQLIQQAQWAVMQIQPKVYSMSLQQTEFWVRHYFGNKGENIQGILAMLADLQKREIDPHMLEISQSLAAIQKINRQKAEDIN